MDSNFAKSKEVYKSKIPEIERTLEIINLLKTRGEEETDGVITSYSLCDTIYAKAKVYIYYVVDLIRPSYINVIYAILHSWTRRRIKCVCGSAPVLW